MGPREIQRYQGWRLAIATRRQLTSYHKESTHLKIRRLVQTIGVAITCFYSPIQSSAAQDICDTIPAYHRLAFLGSWIVFDNEGNREGSDVVAITLKGCAAAETWVGENGAQGLGVLYYTNATNQWTKPYLSDAANTRRGIRERILVAEYSEGGVRVQDVIPGPAGAHRVLNRTTIRPLADGRVHYVVASSPDGKDTWSDSLDAFYVKSTSALVKPRRQIISLPTPALLKIL